MVRTHSKSCVSILKKTVEIAADPEKVQCQKPGGDKHWIAKTPGLCRHRPPDEQTCMSLQGCQALDKALHKTGRHEFKLDFQPEPLMGRQELP